MSEILKRLRGYNPPDRTHDSERIIAQDISDAADETERLRLALAEAHARIADLENPDFVNCDGLHADGKYPNTPHRPIGINRLYPCPACTAERERDEEKRLHKLAYLALAEAQHEAETLKTERNAALTLAEQRGAAYDIEQGLRQKAEREQARAEERARLKYPQWHRVWESEYLARRRAEDEVEKANRYGNEYLNRLIVAESTRDLHWREVESLREWKDKLKAEVDEITALVDKWRSGRAHLGTPATFVDQRLLDGILNVGVSVSGQRGGTVAFSHWSGAATKPDEEHGAKCECCKGDGYYGVADGDGDVDTIICESLVSQRDSWHKEAEAWKQTAANLQARADRFEFLRELLVAVVKTGTKDPLLDARLAEELRSHE